MKNLAALVASRPDRSIDLMTDLGIKPDQGDARENRRLIQSCFAAATARPIILKVPPHVILDRPLSLPPAVQLDGRGMGSLLFPSSHGLVAGLDPAPGGRSVDVADLVDSTSMLDGSVSGRFGVRLDCRQTIAELGGLFSSLAEGPLSALTIDLAYSTRGIPGGRGLAFGWSEQGCPRPFFGWVEHDTGRVVVTAGLGDGSDGMGSPGAPSWEASVPALSRPGTHRLAVQIDRAQGKIKLIADGKTAELRSGQSLTPDARATLARARRVPLKVGGLSACPAMCGSDYVTIPPQDAVVLGFLVSPRARYPWDGDLPQMPDVQRYFEPPDGGVRLSLNDDRRDVVDTRSLYVNSDRRSTAMLLDVNHLDTYNSAIGHRISGLGVEANGDALVVGKMVDARLDNLSLSGTCAIGGWRMGANYSNYASRIKMTGYYACVALDYGMWYLWDVAWGWTPDYGIISVNTKLDLRNCYVGGNSNGRTHSIVRLEGGALTGDDVNIDIEGENTPNVAEFDVKGRTDAANSVGAMVDLYTLNLGTVPAGVPIVKARCASDGTGGIIKVHRTITSGAGLLGAIRVDADNLSKWSVDFPVEALGSADRWPIIDQSVQSNDQPTD